MSQLFTGIKEYDLDNSFFVYPNPATDIVKVNTNENAILSLFDISGKEVISETKQNSLNLSGLAQGMYFLNMKSKNKLTVKKIIKE